MIFKMVLNHRKGIPEPPQWFSEEIGSSSISEKQILVATQFYDTFKGNQDFILIFFKFFMTSVFFYLIFGTIFRENEHDDFFQTKFF